MSRRTDQKRLAKLDAIYARLPTVACRGLCAIACGPVPMSQLEAERLRRADPGRRLPMITPEVRCIYLTPRDRCSVYAVRPLICRIWGTVKRLSCMHGCVPDRWLSDHEFVALAKAVEAVGGPTVISSVGALVAGRSFAELDTSTVDEATAERYADITRAARALYGGHVVGVAPGDGTWIDLDKKTP